MRIADVQLLFDYNYWTTKLILSKAAELSLEQLMQPTSFSWGSLMGTLIHMLDGENLWRNLCQHNHLLEKHLTETESFPTLDSLVVFWKSEEAEMQAYLGGLRDEDMDSIISYEIPEGLRERLVWHCLVHVVNHGTQHRSECAAMLTDFGHSPGDIDFTRFLNARGRGEV
jgi:uncharacterized damage-inducible protein DinB